MNVFWTLQSYSGDSSFLSPLEKDRLTGMQFPKRRVEWLTGRWAAKQVLQQALPEAASLSAESISILNSPDGSPYVLLDQEILAGSLSISHSHGLAFCAFAMGKDLRLGIDLEKIEPRPPVFIEDYFTGQEAAFARSLPSDLRDRWVTLAWSSREAVLKALGIGLRADTRRFEVAGRHLEDLPGWKPLDIRSGLMTAYAAERGGSWGVWWDQQQGFILTVAICCDETVALIQV